MNSRILLLFLSLLDIINLFDTSYLAKFLYHLTYHNVVESSKQDKFQRVYTNLNYFLLLTYSRLQLELLVINHGLSERKIIFVPWLLKLSHVLVVLKFAWVKQPFQDVRVPVA